VLLSARLGCNLRVIGFNPESPADRARLRSLRHPPALRIWDAGYDKDGWWAAERATAMATSMQVRSGRKRPAADALAQQLTAAAYEGDGEDELDDAMEL